MKRKSMSIRDVARKANVSIASVSRVLNNQQDGVSEPIRKKVLDACRELDYRPNPGIQDLVRRGRNGHTRNLAFVVVGQEAFGRHVYASSLDGLAQGSSEGNFSLSLAHMSGDEQNPYDLPPILRDRRVDGFLLTGRINEKTMLTLKELGLPYVILGVYSPKISGDAVRVQLDVNVTVHKLVEEFLKAGKRKIAYLLSDPKLYYAQEFFIAFKRALVEHRLDADDRHVYRVKPACGAAIEALRPVFASPDLPFDGIVSEDSMHAQEIAYLVGVRSGAFGKHDPLIATHRASDEYQLPIPAIYFDGPFYDEAYQGVNLLIDMVSGKVEALGRKLEISTNVYKL